MAVRITLQLDNQTHEGWAEFINDASRAGAATDDFSDELNEAESRISELEGEVEELSDAYEELKHKAASAGDQTKKAGEGTVGMVGKIAAGVTAALALKEAFKKALEFIKMAAEAGNEGMQDLVEAGGQMKQAFLDVFNDPEIQDGLKSFAGFIKDDIAPAVASIPDMWRKAQDASADFFASAGEAMGLFAEGTTETLEEDQARAAEMLQQRREQQEAEREAAEAAKMREDATQSVARIEDALAEERHLQAIGEMNDIAEITEHIEDTRKAIEELAETQQFEGRERERQLNRLATLERRRVQAAEENAQEEADAAEERRRLEEEAEKAHQDALKVIQDKANADAKAAAEKALADAKEAVDAMRELLMEAQGGEDQSTIDQLRGQFTDQDILRQMQDQAAQEARAARVDEMIDSGQVQSGAGGRGSGNFFHNTSNRAEQRAIERELARLEQQARNDVSRNAAQGNITQEQVVEAQDQLVNSVIQQASQSGQLDQRQVQGLQAAADAVDAAARQGLQNQRDIEQIEQQLADVLRSMNNNPRRRSAGGLRN